MKLFKISALSLALIASLFLLNTTTKAATAEVNLKINGVAGGCGIGSKAVLGPTNYSVNGQTITSQFTGVTPAVDGAAAATWYCYDGSGYASWTLSMVMSGNLVNMQNPSYTISSWNVSYANSPVHQQIGSGTCTSVAWASTSATDWKVLSGQRNVLQKNSALGDVCRVQTTGLFLKIFVNSGQAIGTYSWNLVITVPTLS